MGGKGGLVIIGFGVMWLAYAVGWTGYSLVRGYDIPLSEVWSPVHWYKGTWPPEKIPATQVWPSRASGKAATSG